MPKSSWLAPHPLRCSRRRAFGSLKTLFNPSRRISHHLCCGSLPLAFAGSSSQWESIFYSKCLSLSLFLHSSLAHSLIFKLTVFGQLLWSRARCFKRYEIKYILPSQTPRCVSDIKDINHHMRVSKRLMCRFHITDPLSIPVGILQWLVASEKACSRFWDRSNRLKWHNMHHKYWEISFLSLYAIIYTVMISRFLW